MKMNSSLNLALSLCWHTDLALKKKQQHKKWSLSLFNQASITTCCCQSPDHMIWYQPSFSVHLVPTEPFPHWINSLFLCFLLLWHLALTILNYNCSSASFSSKTDYELVQVRTMSDLLLSLQ